MNSLKKTKNISVVGAGVGGLSIAARLASKGFSVDLFEKLDRCGGRAHIIQDKGFLFDTGPSFVLMPDFFAEVFSYCGKNIEDYLTLQILDTSYKIFYSGGRTLSVYRDSEKTKQELEKFEPGSAQKYDAFIKETESMYQAVKPLLYKCFMPIELIDINSLKLLFQLKPFTSYWNLARKYFKDDNICYAMTFEAMFIGVSPFETPGFYSVITYTDHVQKIAHPMGGMYEIPKALERMGTEFGVRYHYGREVKGICEHDQGIALQVGGEDLYADQAVVNADFAYSQTDLLSRRIPNYDYSCSVYLMYLGLKKKVEGVEHHNLFFAEDLRDNLNRIFKDKMAVSDPSFYIHVPTVTDPSLAPEGKDIFYILVPVSNLDDPKQPFEAYEDPLREVVFKRINASLGIRLQDLIEVEHRFYPKDFIGRYNIKNGATFGLAHTLMQSAFFRPANIDRKIKNLFYVGASTQPGGGLPPVMASSRIVADLMTA